MVSRLNFVVEEGSNIDGSADLEAIGDSSTSESGFVRAGIPMFYPYSQREIKETCLTDFPYLIVYKTCYLHWTTVMIVKCKNTLWVGEPTENAHDIAEIEKTVGMTSSNSLTARFTKT